MEDLKNNKNILLKKDIVNDYLINTDTVANILLGGKKSSKKDSKKSKDSKKDKKDLKKLKDKKDKKVKKDKKDKIKVDKVDKEKVEEDKKARNIYEDIKIKLEPIKVILKYKNNNRKNQYETYIFVGSFGKTYQKIFKRIENLSLYETLKEITKEEENILTNAYGDFWITKFFNIYHISYFINKIEQNTQLKTELLKKYDERWLQNFINKFKNDVVFKKINYSYSDLIKFQYKIKMGKKLEKMELEKEDIEELNFKTVDKNILYSQPDIF